MFFERKKNNDFLSINIENLIDWNEPNGEGCIVSDRITKEGFKVGLKCYTNVVTVVANKI